MNGGIAVPSVGERCEPREFGPITRTDFVRYAGASGDFHPPHHDEVYARAAGFPTVFSQGMFQAGLLATYATDWLGAANIRRFSVRFESQCWPDDVLVCEGVVEAVEPHGDDILVKVKLGCTRQTGTPALSGSADFLLRNHPIDGL